MIRVVVSGFYGKTGSRIVNLLQADAECKLVGGLVRALDANKPKTPVPVGQNAKTLMSKADVLIEFTNPEATLHHLRAISGLKKVAAVVGTTALSPGQKEEIAEIAKRLPVVFDSNFSMGIALLKELLRAGLAAKKMGSFDFHIAETHHKAKKDAPSGTAKDLAAHIAGLVGVYPAMSSVRVGDVPGEHTVTMANPYEVLELTHRVYSRDAFAYGAILAAKWAVHQKPGLYRFQDVLRNSPMSS